VASISIAEKTLLDKIERKVMLASYQRNLNLKNLKGMLHQIKRIIWQKAN
jgi:hypothetical protein